MVNPARDRERGVTLEEAVFVHNGVNLGNLGGLFFGLLGERRFLKIAHNAERNRTVFMRLI